MITEFLRFIHGRKFTLQTDQWLLLIIFESKKSKPTRTANSLQCWGIILLITTLRWNNCQYIIKKLGHADGFFEIDPKIFRTFRRYGNNCLKGWKGIMYIVILYNLGVTCDSSRYKRKQLSKRNSWRNRYGWFKERKKNQEYHLFQSVSKYYYIQIEW